jgi:hypothetical protein
MYGRSQMQGGKCKLVLELSEICLINWQCSNIMQFLDLATLKPKSI